MHNTSGAGSSNYNDKHTATHETVRTMATTIQQQQEQKQKRHDDDFIYVGGCTTNLSFFEVGKLKKKNQSIISLDKRFPKF